MTRRPPRLATLLVRLRYSRTASEFLLGDLAEEYDSRHCSNSWYWRQVCSLLWFTAKMNEMENKQSMRFLSGIWTDFRYAARTLTKSPGFSLTAMLAIALGVGVNTGIFTLLNAIALRPLPVPGSRRLVGVYQTFRGAHSRNVNGEASLFSFAEYRDYRDHSHVFSGLLAYYPFFKTTLAGERPRELQGQLATCNYFRVLAVRPALGREFVDSDCAAPGSAAVVVLSDGAWRANFAADPFIVGKSITLNRVGLSVIGIAPPGFHGTEPFASDFWAPITMDPLLHPGSSLSRANLSWLVMLGRLKPGATVSQARADLAVTAGRIDRLYPGRKTTLLIDTATAMDKPEERPYVLEAFWVILTAVSLVLLIACANVANLLLARASARGKEIAVRLSVGASRGRLIRQLLTESFLLALPAGTIGSLLSFWSFNALFRFVLRHLPDELPPAAIEIHPDFRVLTYALALTLVTAIVFGLVPALQASKPNLITALKEEGSGSGTHQSRGLLRNLLVTVQVSVCLTLLIAAGLVARGLVAAQTIDPGIDTKNIAVLTFDLVPQGYNDARAAEFLRDLIGRLQSLPRVDAVAQAVVAPLSMNSWGTRIKLEGRGDYLQIRYNAITPSFFPLFGIPIVRGRNFTDAEMRAGAGVVVVAADTARKLWPHEDPLGKIVIDDKDKLVRVIGIAKDAHSTSLSKLDDLFFYLPISPEVQAASKLLVHSEGSFASTARGVRAAVRAADPNVLVEIKSMDENIDLYRVPGRIVTVLAATLGAFALLLASIGIYGLVSYAVSRRIREIGIRMTLGADRRDVLRLILRGALRPVILGIAIGITACAGVSRVLSSVLYGVSPLDPLAFAGVTIFLLAIALLASYLPARRATCVDPMIALRYE